MADSAAQVQRHKQTVQAMWAALARFDWDALQGCLHPEVHYCDVPTEDPGARGPANVVRRLRIAFDHLAKQEQVLHHIAAEGNVVFLDHTETWYFKGGGGEKAAHTFATLHEMRDGLIYTWNDYWDVNKFVSQYPQWFLAELAKRSAADFA